MIRHLRADRGKANGPRGPRFITGKVPGGARSTAMPACWVCAKALRRAAARVQLGVRFRPMTTSCRGSICWCSSSQIPAGTARCECLLQRMGHREQARLVEIAADQLQADRHAVLAAFGGHAHARQAGQAGG